MPTAATVAAMVQEAAAAHLKGQEEAYQSALHEREQQHLSLLQELAQLRQLHAEPSGASVGSGASTQQDHHQQQGAAGGRDPLQSGNSGPQHQQQQEGNSVFDVNDTGDAQHCAYKELDQVHLWQASPDSDYSLRAWQPGDSSSKPDADGSNAGRVAEPTTNNSGPSQDSKRQQEPSPMSSLIAAVLGSGPTARALQAAHTQRMQRDRPAVQQTQQQEMRSTAAMLHAMDYQGQLAELDQVLGLKQPSSDTAASAVAGDTNSSRPFGSPDRARPAAAATVAAGDAFERSAVAQQIRQQAADAALQQQQQHGALTNSMSPPMARSSQQQAHNSAIKQTMASSSSGNRQACLRCGANESSSPGRCCFHPGFVPVPGPLMYSPEWHACRASCTPDMPGCYSRREHYYLPQFGATAGSAKVGQLNSKTSSGANGPAAAGRRTASPAARAAVSPSRLAAHSSHRSVQSTALQSDSQGDLTPRSRVPRPMTSRTRWH
eukprot:GHUV01028187.1.p1 GENE.GHUV01028187.1~~GHUV01028187.1.p1  ORF type:complete len:491 (+),score=198.15 GHUV01028187.1:859-2331(+)